MITTEWLISSNAHLADKIVQDLSHCMPEEGISILIFDREGQCWGSHPETFDHLNLSYSFLEEIMRRIDDGDEPVVTSIGDTCLVTSQLISPYANYGYVMVVLPGRHIESVWHNIDLIETIIEQVRLLAGYIEPS